MENLDSYKNVIPPSDLDPSQQTLHQLYEVIDSITTSGITFDGVHHYLLEGVKGRLILIGGNVIQISQRTYDNDNVPIVSILVIQNNIVKCEYQLKENDGVLSIERYSTLYPLKSNDPAIPDPLKLERFLGITKTTELEIQTLIGVFSEAKALEYYQ